MSIQNQHKKLTIGLFGFGVVGEGLYKVLENTPSLNATIKKICIKNPEKSRNAPYDLFTANADDILLDASINVVVELINDADAALQIVTKALQSGKAVVSANKKLIAAHFDTLLRLQEQCKIPFLYEAAVCASIPVIRNLEEYYDNDLLQGISGIVNGSTNYILTKVFEEKLDFETALLQAQIEGFAETDPTLDVEGKDAQNKLAILLAHAYGIVVKPHEILCSGIQSLKEQDAIYAKEKGYQIKLVAHAHKQENGKVTAFVLPQFVKDDSQLYKVGNEYNGVVIETDLAEQQFFYGKGAGSFPTASAVLSDLSALRYDYKYEYKKLNYQPPSLFSNDFYLKVYVSFDKLFHVPQEAFEEIIEWGSAEKRCHVIGIIHASRLIQSEWWKNNNGSLIALPEAFIKKEYVPQKTETASLELV